MGGFRGMSGVNAALLTGRDSTAMVDAGDGRLLQAAAAAAFARLAADARASGFELRIASAFRSYDRQCAIFNGKACGKRPVFDDADREVDLSSLDRNAQVDAILRFSALPGASRHHWGTDIDVVDAAAVPAGYEVALSAAEVAPGGVFDPLHRWLDQRIADGESRGFYRPYATDRDGVAPERWHLSYAPLATALQPAMTAELLRECWCMPGATSPCWHDVLVARLPELLARYVHNVDAPPFDR